MSYPSTLTPEPQSMRLNPRRWPWVAGLVVAHLAGAGIGAGIGAGVAVAAQSEVEPEVLVQTETITEEVEVEVEIEVEPADMDERRASLDALESELSDLQGDLEAERADLDDFQEELNLRDEALTATETEIEENTIPGSGMYLVGEDIEPGTYYTDSDMCYWARLSGFSGSLGDIISNGNTDGPTYVTILESDTAFETSRCTDWVKQ